MRACSQPARAGGLIATALAGAVIAHGTDGLTDAFHVAAMVAAALALASGLTVFATLAGSKPG